MSENKYPAEVKALSDALGAWLGLGVLALSWHLAHTLDTFLLFMLAMTGIKVIAVVISLFVKVLISTKEDE